MNIELSGISILQQKETHKKRETKKNFAKKAFSCLLCLLLALQLAMGCKEFELPEIHGPWWRGAMCSSLQKQSKSK